MIKTHLELTGDKFDPWACGNCHSILLGNDEEFCPSCGAMIDWYDERSTE